MRRSEQRKKQRRKKLAAVFAVCLAGFCVSAYMVISQLVREKKDEAAFTALIAQIRPEEPEDSADTSGDTSAARPQTVPSETDTVPPADEPPQSDPGFHRYDDLYAQNSDLFGWIRIEETKIDYPVMHTPDDPEYYLHRAFDGKKSSSGVPFLDGNCYAGCGNYIVYGHHMKNGTMFAGLTDYAKEEFWLEHPIISFDTVDEAGTYEVMAAFYAKAYRVNDTNVFRFYSYTDLTDEAVFDEYLAHVYDAALYDTGVTAQYGDQLLTLTTCSYHTTDGRFVVVAKKIS